MKILYLDQNKWIELARGVKSPDNFPSQYAVVETLVREAKAGNIVIPLTFANLYETQKIGNIERRKHLAWVQSTLSQGKVFRGRHERLRVEVTVTSADPAEAGHFTSLTDEHRLPLP